MSEEFPFPDIELTEDVIPRVPLDEVLDIQTLAMRDVRRLSRTRHANPRQIIPDSRINSYCLLYRSRPEMEDINDLYQEPDVFGDYESDPEYDVLMTVINRRPNAWTWNFSVVFASYIMRREERLNYIRDKFKFVWNRGDDEAVGLRTVESSKGVLVPLGKSALEGASHDEVMTRRAKEVVSTVITTEDCTILRTMIEEQGLRYLGNRIIGEL
jgi:hypothetical protein